MDKMTIEDKQSVSNSIEMAKNYADTSVGTAFVKRDNKLVNRTKKRLHLIF